MVNAFARKEYPISEAPDWSLRAAPEWLNVHWNCLETDFIVISFYRQVNLNTQPFIIFFFASQ